MSIVTQETSGTEIALMPEDVDRRLLTIPFVRTLRLRARHVGHGHAVSWLMRRPALAAPGNDRAISDGALLTALDQTGSIAIWSAFGLHYPHATVSLSASLACVAEAETLSCEARLISTEGGICYTELAARDGDSGRVIARGMANFVSGAYPGGKMEERVPMSPAGTSAEDLHEEWRNFNETLGIACSGDRGLVPLSERIVGSTAPVALHGGAIAAGLVETGKQNVGGHDGLRLSHLAIEFLHSGLAAQTSFRSHLVHRSGRTATLRTDARQANDIRHVAAATLRFTNF